MTNKKITEAEHQAMFEHYDSILKDIGPGKVIGPEEEEALEGAFFHAKWVFGSEELFDWFIDRADPFLMAAAWKLLTTMYEELLEILEQENPGRLESVRLLNRLAFIYRSTGDYEKALPFYGRALEILDNLHKQEPDNKRCSSYVAGTLNNFGVLLSEMDLTEEAEESYVKALKLREEIPDGPENPEVARILNNLGLLYHQTGQHEKAQVLLNRALDIFEKLGRTDHPAYASTLNNLAGVYVHKIRLKEAEILYERALTLREKSLGPEHPEVAKTLNNLAELYRSMGENKKAKPLYERALSINEKVLGHDHMDVGTTLNNLAGLHESLGEYATAIELYERALEIIEKELGIDHPYFKITRNNLLALYEKIESSWRE